MNVLFVLQTHTVSNSQDKPDKKMRRYTGTDKAEVTKRCVRSLVKSINYCKQQEPKVEYHLQVFDDHSDQASVETLKNTLSTANFSTSLSFLETRGIMPSIHACYSYAREHGKDLIYFIQDDYLFQETCIWEMIDMYFQAVQITGKRVCICPYDHPYRYDIRPPTVGPILLGKKRHWKVAYHTPATFMFSHQTITEDWDLFEDLTRQSPLDPMLEDLTINRLFSERGHVLFTPIPSAALHLQYLGEKDPYIDWASWWNLHGDSDVRPLDLSNRPNVLLNVGCGSTSYNVSPCTEDIKDKYDEIRVDIDVSCGPDLVSKMEDLSRILSNSVQCVYSSHSLEHLEWHKIPGCLREWFRVLRSGGHLRIVVPNLKILWQHVKDGNILDTLYHSSGGPIAPIDMLYGHRGLVAKGNAFMSHKTGFTKESATQLLHELGYQSFSVEEHDINLLMKIYK